MLQRGIGLMRGIVLAWLLPPAEFGLFGVALLIVNVLLPLTTAGVYEGVTRYAPQHEIAGTLRAFCLRAAAVAGALVLGSTVLLFVLSGILGPQLFAAAQAISSGASAPSDTGAVMRSVAVCLVTLGPYHVVLNMLRGLRLFRAAAAMELLTGIVFTLVALTAAAVGYNTTRALMYIYAGANVLSILAFLPGVAERVAGERVRSTAPPAITRTLLRYSSWLALTAFVWHLLSYYPTWHLLSVTDRETVGAFQAVRTITQLVQILGVMLAGVVAAHAAHLYEQQGRAAAPRVDGMTHGTLLVLLWTATVLSVGQNLLMRLFPASYAGGSAAFDPLMLFYLLAAAVGLLAVRMNLIERPRLVCWSWLVGAAAAVIAGVSLLGSPWGGPSAAAPDSAQVTLERLTAAAWIGVAGAAAALVTALALLYRARFAPPAATLLLIALAAAVGFGPLWAAGVGLIVAVLATCTNVWLAAEDRARLFALLRRPRPS